MFMQERMSRLPELVAAAKRVIENVDSDALLSYFGMKTDLRQGAPAIKMSVPPCYTVLTSSVLLCADLWVGGIGPVLFRGWKLTR